MVIARVKPVHSLLHRNFPKLETIYSNNIGHGCVNHDVFAGAGKLSSSYPLIMHTVTGLYFGIVDIIGAEGSWIGLCTVDECQFLVTIHCRFSTVNLISTINFNLIKLLKSINYQNQNLL